MESDSNITDVKPENSNHVPQHSQEDLAEEAFKNAIKGYGTGALHGDHFRDYIPDA